MNALLLGSVEFLRDPTNGLGLPANVCDEQDDGQPPPSAGQLYYGVFDEGSTNDQTEYVHEEFAITVRITVRTPWSPKDRQNENVRQYLRRLADELKSKMVQGEQLLRIQANKHIDDADNDFVEPLRYLGTSKIATRGPEWFWAVVDSTHGDVQSGASIDVRWGKAVRAQKIEETE